MTDVRDVPILILAYNRADRLHEVVDALRPCRPRRIFLSVDGPRLGDDADRDKVLATQEVARHIDWDAEVRSHFQPVNLGCGLGVSTGISWFFDEVNEGIILEDDVVPGPDFCPSVRISWSDIAMMIGFFPSAAATSLLREW